MAFQKLSRSGGELLESRFVLALPAFADGEISGFVESTEVDAASGLVASRANRGVLWAQNDVGDSRLFAMNESGEHLAIYETSVAAVDWEDLAIGPGATPGVDYIYIADTGDNSENRSQVVVYRAAEPQVAADQSPVHRTLAGVESIQLRYPDGAHDAETLLVDPNSGDVYIITKRDARSRIYRAAFPQSTSMVTTLEYVGQLTWTAASAGDISPDGDEIILKNLGNVYYYPRSTGASVAHALAMTPRTLPYIREPLGEGLTFDAGGEGYFTHSEGMHQPLYYYERLSTSGDLDGDGIVNRIDAAILARHFGSPSGESAGEGDLDGDGAVTLADLAMLQSRFNSESSHTVIAAPESTVQKAQPKAPSAGLAAKKGATLLAIRRSMPTVRYIASLDAALTQDWTADRWPLGRVHAGGRLPTSI